MSELTITVQNRETTGKSKNRQLRAQGNVPAVVYGDGLSPSNIQVATRDIEKLLREAGDNAVFLLELEGTDQRRHAMIKDYDLDLISGAFLHIDFQRVNMEQVIRIQVPVELVGEPIGVRMEGGMVDFINREVEVECLPANIPSTLRADIEELHIGQHVEAKDLELGEGVSLVDDPERVIASISQAQMAEEVVEEEEEGLEEGIETEAEGDAPAEEPSED